MSVVPLVISLCDSALLLFLAVYYIVNLSDLECSHINASVCCARLTKVVIPEVVLCSVVSICLVCWGYFAYLPFTVPMVVWLIYRVLTKPRSSISFYDPAEIMNRQQLKVYINESIVKLLYHLFAFFIFLYSMVTTLVGEMEESTGGYFPHEM